ncbi:MAG TPA: hypothetical protein VFO78_04775, partial [Candidatus Limnocylindrales bacterium]|nr:hypothetical protein [Candidatus Limnocylindrales bacterium]
MTIRRDPTERQLESPLGRVSPLAKLIVAFGWLLGLATTTSIGPPLALAAIAAAAGVLLGR